MMNIPKEGDAVFIQSDFYTGDAIITYVDIQNLYNHHTLPIQAEVNEGELHQFEDFNHGQTIVRFCLKDLMGIKQVEELESIPVLEDNVQGTLFDF